MHSVIEDTLKERKEFTAFCSEHMSENLLLHVKQYFSDINKSIMLSSQDTSYKAYPLYRNIQKFFEDFADEVTDYGILYTLYICAAELNISTQIYDAFAECIIPEECIKLDDMSCPELFMLDFEAQGNIIKQIRDEATDDDVVLYCGLHTLNLLNYLEVR